MNTRAVFNQEFSNFQRGHYGTVPSNESHPYRRDR